MNCENPARMRLSQREEGAAMIADDQSGNAYGYAVKSAEPRRYGFVIWGFICLAISLVGFWPSYVAPMSSGTYQSPSPMMPWHVLSTVLWLALLISQPLLIQQNQIKLHRQFGVFGVFVATAVVITGTIVQVDVMGPYAASGDRLNAVIIPFIRLTLLLGFVICVGLAVALRKQPEAHKRLILLGTFTLFQSAFDRMGANVFGMPEARGLFAIGGHFVLMVLFVIWDRWRSGYFHPVTKWGTVSLVLFYFFSPIFAGSPWWRDLAARLANLD
jgi:hypothetical protein